MWYSSAMARPKLHRRLAFDPTVRYFKPRGIPLRELEEIELLSDELEALKLYLVDDLDQTAGAQKMGVSQPTFARIFASANKKLADAIINGKAIKLANKT